MADEDSVGFLFLVLVAARSSFVGLAFCILPEVFTAFPYPTQLLQAKEVTTSRAPSGQAPLWRLRVLFCICPSLLRWFPLPGPFCDQGQGNF